VEAPSVPENEINILLVDSVQLRSQLLLGALRRHRQFKVTLCNLDGDSVLQTLKAGLSDVVVMGSDHPEASDSLSLVRRINLSHPEVATVLLTQRTDRNLVVNIFRSGARGIFCYGESHLGELCRCIRRVHEGQIWANAEQLRYLLDELTHVPALRVLDASGDNLLSEREEQVVGLVADGLTNRAVAAELGLSENTIKKYLFRIFEKVGISTRVELVLYAFHHGRTREAEWVPGN
jgi:DNA-binding NarL/FixJ family response regulator